MTDLQTKLYWRSFAAAKAAKEQLQGRPMTAKEAAQWRYWLHDEAECPSSSKAFTNAHFDSFLSVCFSWSHPVSLERQARQIDQPITRYRYVIDDILDQTVAYCDASDLQRTADPYRQGRAREGFILFMLRKLSKQHHLTDPTTFPAAAWRSLLAATRARYDQLYRQTEGRPYTRTKNPIKHQPYARGQSRPAALIPAHHTDDNCPF